MAQRTDWDCNEKKFRCEMAKQKLSEPSTRKDLSDVVIGVVLQEKISKNLYSQNKHLDFAPFNKQIKTILKWLIDQFDESVNPEQLNQDDRSNVPDIIIRVARDQLLIIEIKSENQYKKGSWKRQLRRYISSFEKGGITCESCPSDLPGMEGWGYHKDIGFYLYSSVEPGCIVYRVLGHSI